MVEDQIQEREMSPGCSIMVSSAAIAIILGCTFGLPYITPRIQNFMFDCEKTYRINKLNRDIDRLKFEVYEEHSKPEIDRIGKLKGKDKKDALEKFLTDEENKRSPSDRDSSKPLNRDTNYGPSASFSQIGPSYFS
jgi:hypothetical protein